MTLTNLFGIALNDQSVYYLGRVFGNVGTVLPGTGPALMGAMFKTFNTAVLSMGAILVTYTTGAGIILTAHEGDFLGKDFHSLWLPLRTVTGIAALAPTSTGYSAIQIFMMWVILQGVGAADVLWGTVLNYFNPGQGGTPGALNTPAGVGIQAYNDVSTLFASLTCQAAAKASYNSDYFCGDPNNSNNSFCITSDNTLLTVPSTSPYKMGPDGACGILSWNTNSGTAFQQAVGQAQAQAYQNMIPTLGAIASQLVATDYQYNVYRNSAGKPLVSPMPAWLQSYCAQQGYNENNCASGLTEPPGKDAVPIYWQYSIYPFVGANFIQDAATLYTGTVSAVQVTSNTPSNLSGLFATAAANGWIYAGGYYYTIAQLTNSVQQGALQPMQFSNNNLPPSTPPLGGQNGYTAVKDSYLIATTMTQLITTQQQQGGASGAVGQGVGGGSASFLAAPLGAISDFIISTWMGMLTNSSSGGIQNNPMITMQTFGEDVLITVQVMVVALITVVFVTVLAGSFMDSVQPLGNALSTLIEFISPPIWGFLMLIFAFAATLAVYTPMVPYIYFTFGAIGWIASTIETMIAAPLVALALLSPEGDKMYGQAKSAFMLIFSIFLRPSLMVFGMMAGMLLIFVVISMINAGFLGVMNQLNANPGPIEVCLFLGVYTGMVTTAVQECFSLIYEVPQKVLRWIGGQGDSFGEKEKAGQVQGSFNAASKQAESGAGKAKSSLDSGAKAIKGAAGGGAPGGSTISTSPAATPPATPPAGGSPPDEKK